MTKIKEMFDIVDLEDQVIDQAERTDVHGNPDLIHRAIHVFVFNSHGLLFLQKRDLSKDIQPGKWDTSVGGHLDSGESYGSAALREMEEELGIGGVSLGFLYKYIHHSEVESEYVSTYSCTWDGEIKINQNEIEEGKFWSLDAIAGETSKDLFTPLFLEELNLYQRFILGV